MWSWETLSKIRKGQKTYLSQFRRSENILRFTIYVMQTSTYPIRINLPYISVAII